VIQSGGEGGSDCVRWGQKIASFSRFGWQSRLLYCNQAEGETRLGSLRQFRFSNSLTANEYTRLGEGGRLELFFL
jgi:hypothetical protein